MTKYNMQFSWCIYQTRIFREAKNFTSKLLGRKRQDQKKYSLIDEHRDLIRNNDRARTFPQFLNQQDIVMVTELKQQFIISNNDLLFHLNDLFLKFIQNNNLFKTMESKIRMHENATNRLCCAKNELTIGLVYTE